MYIRPFQVSHPPQIKKLMWIGSRMVVNITSIMGNGRHDQVFTNRSGILLY